jgi:hypothetical protein
MFNFCISKCLSGSLPLYLFSVFRRIILFSSFFLFFFFSSEQTILDKYAILISLKVCLRLCLNELKSAFNTKKNLFKKKSIRLVKKLKAFLIVQKA